MEFERPPKVPWDSRWREIPGFTGYYLSQYGQVFNLKRQQLVAIYYNTRNLKCVRMYQKSAYGARGVSRGIDKLLREVFPREPRMTDLEPRTLADEIKALKTVMGDQPNGSYHIPGVRFTERNPTVGAIHTLVSRLSFYFPNYIWGTTDSLDPSIKGMTVSWTKKPEKVGRVFSKDKELTDGN